MIDYKKRDEKYGGKTDLSDGLVLKSANNVMVMFDPNKFVFPVNQSGGKGFDSSGHLRRLI